MPLDFLDSATGDPTKRQARFAGHDDLDAYPILGADYREGAVWLGPIRIRPQTVERQALSATRQPNQRLQGKTVVEYGDLSFGDLDPANPLQLLALANYFGKYAVTNPSGSHYRWRLDTGQATDAPRYLACQDLDDVLPARTFYGWRFGGFTLQAEGEGNLSLVVPSGSIAGPRGYTFAGLPVQRAGSGSDLPIPAGNWDGVWAEAITDRSIFIRIVTIPDGNGDYTYQTILADAGSVPIVGDFTGTAWAGTLDQKARAYKVDDDRIGNFSSQPTFIFETGATLVADDIFEIPARHGGWTPSLPAAAAMSSVSALLIADGEERTIDGGWTLTASRQTTETRQRPYGVIGATPKLTGVDRYVLQFEREIVDLDFQKKCHEAETVSVVLHCEADERITGTVLGLRYLFVLPACTVEGPMYSAEAGAPNTTEDFELVAGVPDAAFTYDGISDFDQALNVLIDNELSAL